MREQWIPGSPLLPPHFSHTHGEPGDEARSTPDQGFISAVQLLVVHFYDHTNSAEEVNKAHKQLFTLKGRAMVTFIPPTQAALQKELLAGHVWRQMFIRHLICLLLHTDLIKFVQTLTYCTNYTSNLYTADKN